MPLLGPIRQPEADRLISGPQLDQRVAADMRENLDMGYIWCMCHLCGRRIIRGQQFESMHA